MRPSDVTYRMSTLPDSQSLDTCDHGERPVTDCPTCGKRGIARCACLTDVRCPAHEGR